MTKGEEVIAAVIEKLTGVAPLEDVFDTTVLERAEGMTCYAVVSEDDEAATTPAGQTITPLDCRTQIKVGLVAVGGDTTEIRFAAVKLLRQAQEAVQNVLCKRGITFGGAVRQFIYGGARNIPNAQGESVSFVREMRFDALWDFHLPDEA